MPGGLKQIVLCLMAACVFSGCTRNSKNDKGENVTIAGNPGPSTPAENAQVIHQEDGLIVAEIGASLVAQRVEANGAGDGAAVIFPPGAVPAGTLVTLEIASSLAAPERLADIGLNSDGQAVTAAGPALAVTTQDNAPATTPFTLVLALPAAAGLASDPYENLAVLYHTRSAGEFDFKYGILPRSALQIDRGVVYFDTKIFGVYQAIILAQPLVEAKETHTQEAFSTKSQAAAKKPGDFSLTSIGDATDATPDLKWDAADGALSYQVGVSSKEDCSKILTGKTLTQTVWTVAEALADGTYYACVIANGEAQTVTRAKNTGLKFTIDTTPPGEFTLTMPSLPAYTRPLSMTWTAAAGATAYKVRTATNSSCTAGLSDFATTTDLRVTLPNSGFGTYLCVAASDGYNERNATNNGLELSLGWKGISVGEAVWNHDAIWTGTKLFVWGGCANTVPTCTGATLSNVGQLYDSKADTWSHATTTNAPTARQNHVIVWTGSKAMVFGGRDSNANLLNSGALYDPSTNGWQAISTAGAPSVREVPLIAANASGKVFVFSGNGPSNLLSDGALYDPAQDLWTTVSGLANTPAARVNTQMIAMGNKFVVWGGRVSGGSVTNTGAIFDPGGSSWTTMSTVNAPDARRLQTLVWTGSRLLVWGGCAAGDCTDYPTNAGLYNPETNEWTLMTNPEPARIYSLAVWNGSKLLVWGGNNAAASHSSDVMIYDPSTDIWSAVSGEGTVPQARAVPTGGWTGTALLMFGGVTSVSGSNATLGTGALFYP